MAEAVSEVAHCEHSGSAGGGSRLCSRVRCRHAVSASEEASTRVPGSLQKSGSASSILNVGHGVGRALVGEGLPAVQVWTSAGRHPCVRIRNHRCRVLRGHR